MERFQSLVRKAGGGSRLMPALMISLALHFLLLWPAALPRMAMETGQAPLVATLRSEAVHEPPPPPAPRGTPVSGKASHARSAAAEQPVVAVAFARPAPAVMVEQAAASPGAAATDTARGMAPAAAGEGEGPDAEGLRAYRIGLAREARAHRRYPPLARERGWTGTAEVRVDVSPGGQPWQVLLARSSGHDILDREAVLLMRNAAATTVLPDSLRGREFAVRMPVTFDIAEMQ
jgi:protein TonB